MPDRSIIEVLLNARAGTRGIHDLVETIRAHFLSRQAHANITLINEGGDLRATAQQALAAQPDVIVAGGGDGTVNTVARELAGTPMPLGVLPLGTFNHFAKDLGIPLDLVAAIETICRGSVVSVDVGRVNGHLFLNNSSLGLYPQVVQRRNELHERLGHSKWPAFVWAALSVLRRYPFLDVQMDVDGQPLHRRTPLVFIGNNSYELDGLKLGARKRLDAGHLSVHVIDRTDRLGLLVLAARALIGRLRQARDFETFRAMRVDVQTRRTSIMVTTDGEVNRMSTPLVYTVEKLALKVVAPVVRTGVQT